ncbi:TIGR01777 family oxidoreductase [Aquihabitans daechungensis]|uniref:TIGR01777 family oxidoreductase n=1 Tax=Aquihabitans daechungensis TaxID=1052257 RepID=UPI003BA2EC4D
MDIAITGSTGLIGQALTSSLRADGHRVVPIVRSGGDAGSVRWDPAAGSIDAAGLEGVDGVVHLAGEGIASGPWTDAQRTRIKASREQGTKLLAATLAGLDRPPSVLVSGSAIGFYGDRGDEVLTEGSGPGDDFLAGVCLAWEGATSPAEAAGIRTVHLRTGIVLDAHGGALAKQLPAFKLGLGAKAGSGRQWMSWITLHDEVRAIRFALDEPAVHGPLNLTAPEPVTNAAFTDAVGEALHRPTFLTIPRLARRAPFGVGDLVESLLFSSARVEPAGLRDAGFVFDHPRLEPALGSVLART